jgi:hypothetical protein
VDAGDYSVWRNNLGATAALGAGGGSVGETDALTVEPAAATAAAAVAAVEPPASDPNSYANFVTVATAPVTVPPTPGVDLAPQGEDVSLLLVVADEPARVDKALEEYGLDGLAADDAEADGESSGELGEAALAVAWQSWDEL